MLRPGLGHRFGLETNTLGTNTDVRLTAQSRRWVRALRTSVSAKKRNGIAKFAVNIAQTEQRKRSAVRRDGSRTSRLSTRFLQSRHVEKCKTGRTPECVTLGASRTDEVHARLTLLQSRARAYRRPIFIGRNRRATRPRCEGVGASFPARILKSNSEYVCLRRDNCVVVSALP